MHLPQKPHDQRLPPDTVGGRTLNEARTTLYARVLGQEPEFDAQPHSPEEIAEAIQWADGAGKAVIPWGGGNGQTYGYAPVRADILLDLTRLNRILAIEPGDLTITVEGGVTLAAIQEALAPHGQYLPIAVPDRERATIGGILATAADSAARDYLIGIRVVDAQGRMIKGGGKVVKNVTGYDLPRMHLGALGTLGVIVEATFKVAPLPEASRSLLLQGVSEPLLRRIHAETQPAESLWIRSETADVWRLTYSGVSEVVTEDADKARKSATETGATWEANVMRPEIPEAFSLIVRISGPPASAATRHEALGKMHNWQRIETNPGTGEATIYARNEEDSGVAILSLISWADAHRVKFTVLHAPLLLRQGEFSLWHPLPPSLSLMRRLKETLDPKGTLNPGRFLDRL